MSNCDSWFDWPTRDSIQCRRQREREKSYFIIYGLITTIIFGRMVESSSFAFSFVLHFNFTRQHCRGNLTRIYVSIFSEAGTLRRAPVMADGWMKDATAVKRTEWLHLEKREFNMTFQHIIPIQFSLASYYFHIARNSHTKRICLLWSTPRRGTYNVRGRHTKLWVSVVQDQELNSRQASIEPVQSYVHIVSPSLQFSAEI